MKLSILYNIKQTILSLLFFLCINGAKSQNSQYLRYDYKKATIDTTFKLIGNLYEKPVDFSFVNFNSRTTFLSVFDTPATFKNAKFNSTVEFNASQFFGPVNFSGTTFKEDAIFLLTTFTYDANFNESHFKSLAMFGRAVFGLKASFHKARFDTTVLFTYSELPDTLDFSYVTTKKVIDFTYTTKENFSEVCKINLLGTDINKIRLRYDRFQLYFPKNTNFEHKLNVYEQLLNKTKKDGYIESYEKLDTEYKYIVYKHKNEWLKHFFDKYWWDYGYKKERIILNTFILFLFFCLVNTLMINHLINNVYVLQNLKRLSQTIMHKGMKRVFRHFTLSVFYTSLIFFGLKFSIEKLKYEENLLGLKVFNLLYFALMYISGLICLGYLANFIIVG